MPVTAKFILWFSVVKVGVLGFEWPASSFNHPTACNGNQTLDISLLRCVYCPENAVPKKGLSGRCTCREGWRVVQDTGSVKRTGNFQLTCEPCPVGTRPSRPDGRRCIKCSRYRH